LAISFGCIIVLSLAEMNIGRVVHLVNDILDIEKLESGMLTFQMEAVDLDNVICRSIESATGFAQQQGVQIIYQSQKGKIVTGDSERLTQVVVNLLSNAIKFSQRGGLVNVAVSGLNAGKFTVEIVDRGRGVPANQRASIFERFRQVEYTDSTAKGGSGLGLAICRALIEEHGGTIGVDDANQSNDSLANKGSKFWFTLPAR